VFLSEIGKYNAKRDIMMVTIRQYGDDSHNRTATLVRSPMHCHICTVTIVLSSYHHQTVATHDRTVVLSPSYSRLDTIVLSRPIIALSFCHHRFVLLTTSFCRSTALYCCSDTIVLSRFTIFLQHYKFFLF
jgi:hypothetical protein